MRWKQWRWARTKIRHMVNLGVAGAAAILHGVNNLSHWRMARTPVTQHGHVQSMAQGAGIAERQGLVMQGPGLFDLTDIERLS